MTSRVTAACVALGAILLGGCGDELSVSDVELPPLPREVEAAGDDAPSAAAAYEAVEVADAGRIVGTVRFQGPRPALPTIAVERDQAVCGLRQPAPVLSVGADGGVASAVVFLEGVRRGRPIAHPAEPLVIDQVRCQHVPHVTVASVGAEVVFKNSDAALHNVRVLYADDTWLNLGQPDEGAMHRSRLERAGVAHIVCDSGHPWTLAWIHAFDHPYFASTDEKGGFVIEGVPPGEHRLTLWHEGWDVVGMRAGRPAYSPPVRRSLQVTVPAAGEVSVEFILPPPQAPEAQGPALTPAAAGLAAPNPASPE